MDVEEDFNHGGTNLEEFGDKANHVRILHDDGTMALYAHLDLASVIVRPGARVRAGQKIARSGNTGFSSGPHLHFAIQQNVGMKLISVPFRFQSGRRRPLEPEANQYSAGHRGHPLRRQSGRMARFLPHADMTELTTEIAKRRTFAIISHPDAGKTTLTEKLLLFGGAIQMAGTVKAKKAARHATSDWMKLEKERGISVTSSVMQFNYGGLRGQPAGHTRATPTFRKTPTAP